MFRCMRNFRWASANACVLNYWISVKIMYSYVLISDVRLLIICIGLPNTTSSAAYVHINPASVFTLFVELHFTIWVQINLLQHFILMSKKTSRLHISDVLFSFLNCAPNDFLTVSLVSVEGRFWMGKTKYVNTSVQAMIFHCFSAVLKCNCALDPVGLRPS